MNKSKAEFVKKFEQNDVLLPHTYIIVRVDGKGFTKFCDTISLEKPNDMRLIQLMNKTAKHIMMTYKEIELAYGQRDEFNFVFKKKANVFNRRHDKVLSTIVSLFSSAFMFYFDKYFIDTRIVIIPSFEAKVVLLPSLGDVKAYISYRQVDCHVENLN